MGPKPLDGHTFFVAPVNNYVGMRNDNFGVIRLVR